MLVMKMRILFRRERRKRDIKKDGGSSHSRHERSSKRPKGLPPLPEEMIYLGEGGFQAAKPAEIALDTPGSRYRDFGKL